MIIRVYYCSIFSGLNLSWNSGALSSGGHESSNLVRIRNSVLGKSAPLLSTSIVSRTFSVNDVWVTYLSITVVMATVFQKRSFWEGDVTVSEREGDKIFHFANYFSQNFRSVLIVKFFFAKLCVQNMPHPMLILNHCNFRCSVFFLSGSAEALPVEFVLIPHGLHASCMWTLSLVFALLTLI